MNIESTNESIELKEELPEEDKTNQLSQTD
jgi:hypothetical protein